MITYKMYTDKGSRDNNEDSIGMKEWNSEWEPLGEVSKVFTAYAEEYELLCDIMKKYQQLALRDIGVIQTIGNELEKMDYKLVNMFGIGK